jgi:SnoaL-like domain
MEDDMDNAQQLADRYVAVWHETDPERRRRAIADLWTPDGEHYVGAREVRGYDELEQRIKGSHEKNIRDNGHRFRAVKGARALRDVVTFHWEMLPATSEQVVATGLEILLIDAQGRILVDYQFNL